LGYEEGGSCILSNRTKKPLSVGGAVRKAHRPVYHYTNAGAAISILETKTFWMSEAAVFNDPYDCKLKVKNDHLMAQCLEAIGGEVLKGLKGAPSALEGKESFEIVKRASSVSGSGKLTIGGIEYKKLQKWVTKSIQKYDQAINDAATLTRGDARVTSFCQSGTKLSLWGYYGNRGTGVCLVVDFEARHWNHELLEVEYREKVPELLTVWNWLEVIFNLRRLHEILAPEELVKTLLRTKSMDWQHESEVRFAGLHNGPPTERDTFSFDGNEIVGILAGYAIDPDEYKKLKLVARRLKIPYGQVKMREDDYELYFD
jgi:Protein of unknown function (DUF2971)